MNKNFQVGRACLLQACSERVATLLDATDAALTEVGESATVLAQNLDTGDPTGAGTTNDWADLISAHTILELHKKALEDTLTALSLRRDYYIYMTPKS